MVKTPTIQMVKGENIEVLMDLWKECECVAKQRELERVDKLLQSSKITPAFRNLTFERFDLRGLTAIVTDAYRKATIYCNKFDAIRKTANNGLCLLGRPGCGKTHLITAIANTLLDRDIEVLYFPYVSGMEEIKSDMKKEDVNKQRFEKMKSVPVLFIDDLFKPPTVPSDYDLKLMFNVINHRYMEKLPILISSELSINEMVMHDEGLGSRINEMCKEFRVLMKGGVELNYRLRED